MKGIALNELAPMLDLKERKGNIYFEQWRALFYAMAETRRFGSMKLHDYVDIHDMEKEMQFAALAADL